VEILAVDRAEQDEGVQPDVQVPAREDQEVRGVLVCQWLAVPWLDECIFLKLDISSDISAHFFSYVAYGIDFFASFTVATYSVPPRRGQYGRRDCGSDPQL
tara:strand:+ start:475 stop:777 length:303 start_codon:yes stop_codon:yes gene_type:complete